MCLIFLKIIQFYPNCKPHTYAVRTYFFIGGHGYGSYRKTMGRGLGLGVISDKPLLDVIDLAFPHIRDILDQMCEKEKEYIKAVPSDQLGSWSHAVTTCDGCSKRRGAKSGG